MTAGNSIFFKQVNWKYNPGVKYYKFKINKISTMLKIKISDSVF